MAYGQQLQDLIEQEVQGTVILFGGPQMQRRVDLDLAALEAANLSLDEVAGIVATAAREISAGNPDASAQAVQTGSLPTTAQEIGDLPLRVLPDGSTLRLEDVGQVTIASDPEKQQAAVYWR